MEGVIDNSSQPAQTCEEYKNDLTAGLHPYQIASFIIPLNDTIIWTERDDAWKICFIVYTALMTIIFLMLGIVSVVLLIKKDCIRLSTKTFFSVYMSIIVLGFSRALWLGLDTFGLIGFIGDRFPRWLIISRVLAVFGFPSLVASYTLMIFTLLKITKAKPGKQWYHQWRYVLPLLLSPYFIAILAQVISEVVPYPGVVVVLVCESFFAVWGIIVCIAFLSAGNRLLRELRNREKKTIRVSSTVNPSRENYAEEMAVRQEFATNEHQRHTKRTRRTTRKITIITYGTALFAIIYSLVTTGGVVMVCLLLSHSCFGFENQRGNSTAWLVLEVCKRIIEITLVLVMLYSITDVTGVVKLMCSCCMKDKRVVQCNNPSGGLHDLVRNKSSSQMSMFSSMAGPYGNNVVGNRTDAGGSEVVVPRSILVDDEVLEQSQETVHHENVTDTEELEDSIHISVHLEDLTLEQDVETVCHIGTETSDTQLTEINNPVQPQSPSQVLISTQGDSGISLGSSSESSLLNQNTSQTIMTDTNVTGRHREHEDQDAYRKSKSHATLCTISTQTVDVTDSACQTDPSAIMQVTKPIPKPRTFKPRLSRNRAAKAQRLAALQQTPEQLTSSTSRFKRKQTV